MNRIRVEELPGRACAAAGALELVGDRWALLVVREVSLGAHRFTDIAAGTGAPRDRLAQRLKDLVAIGVLERRPYSTAPARFEYHLTEAGLDLLPVLQSLRQWGERWAVEEAPALFQHRGHAARGRWVCEECGEPLASGLHLATPVIS